MRETYEEMRARHESEVRRWVHEAFAGGRSINSVARENGVNVGTIWRLERQHGKKEETA
jgi:transposase-like protein